VPHVKTNGMAWFYWAAAEAFIPKGRSEMLPEIAIGFQKLDVKSYDPDALSHLLDYLLSHGYEIDALALAEHFLPIQRDDPNLLGWVVPDLVYLIFELRLGQQFRTVRDGASVDAVAQLLRCDIEKAITEDAVRLGAEICCQYTPDTPWTRSCFELVIRAHHGNIAAQRTRLLLLNSVLRVAKEAWRVEHAPAGCALHGVHLIQSAAYEHVNDKKRAVANLLD
jgi:hypothetical protein